MGDIYTESMKTIFLIQNRLRQYFIKNKAIFIIFIIGGVLNASVFAYMYGNLKPKIVAKSLTSIAYRIYDVYFNVSVNERGGVKIIEPEKSYVSEKDVEKIIDTGLFESVIRAYRPELPEGEFEYETYDERPFSVSVGTVDLGTFGLKIRGVLELTGNDQVLIDDSLLFDYTINADVGDTIDLYGKQFIVKGMYRGSSRVEAIVTPEAFGSLGLPVNYIQCISKENWHRGQAEGDVPYNTLKELFPDSHIVSYGDSVSANDERIAQRGVETTVVTYVVSAIAFVFLMVFMAGSISDENASSIISGAGPARITAQVFLEGWVLSAVTVFLGLAVHALLYPSLFSRINISEGVYYTFGDYAAMACIMLVINAIVLAIVSARYMMLTPVELRRKAS